MDTLPINPTARPDSSALATKETPMPVPTIFVTGPTGKTGTAIVEQLLAQGYPVQAGVHAIDVRSERLRRLGATVVQADLFDSEALTAAMRGTQRAYFCPPSHPNMLQAAVSFAAAARSNRIEAIVGLSQWLASPSHPSLLTRQQWLVDQMFSMMPDTLHVTVNPGYFADNYLRFIDMAAQLGVLPVPKGAGRNAPRSRPCGSVALTDSNSCNCGSTSPNMSGARSSSAHRPITSGWWRGWNRSHSRPRRAVTRSFPSRNAPLRTRRGRWRSSCVSV
jgi:hypothetical protein